MNDQTTLENTDIIINRIASELERLKSEIDKLLGQIYRKTELVAPGNGNRKTRHMTPPSSGLKYPEVRNFIIDLRGKLFSINQIVKAIKMKWPRNPEKHVSKSTIYRFIMMARQGRLDYYNSFNIARMEKRIKYY
jgi:IS30 family transposase